MKQNATERTKDSIKSFSNQQVQVSKRNFFRLNFFLTKKKNIKRLFAIDPTAGMEEEEGGKATSARARDEGIIKRGINK